MGETTDQIRQWHIKAISDRVADEITEAARTSTPKVTVGQLLERVWDHWQTGSIVMPAQAPTTIWIGAGMVTAEELLKVAQVAKILKEDGAGMPTGIRAKLSQETRAILSTFILRTKAAMGMSAKSDASAAALVRQSVEQIESAIQ